MRSSGGNLEIAACVWLLCCCCCRDVLLVAIAVVVLVDLSSISLNDIIYDLFVCLSSTVVRQNLPPTHSIPSR